MNEAETRAEHIDPLLAAAGWGVVEGSRIRREYPITLGGAQKKIAALAAIFFASFFTTEFFIAVRRRLDFVPLTECKVASPRGFEPRYLP